MENIKLYIANSALYLDEWGTRLKSYLPSKAQGVLM